MRKIKKVQIEEEHKFIIIKSNKKPDEDIPLIFTFANFNSSSISIDGFNNYYANEKDFAKKISVLFGKALPLLSKEKLSIFSDLNKMDQLHLHLIKGKEKILREILREYLQHTIDFAVENKLPFCDEFYIADSLDAKDRLHVTILNYDVPGDAVYEIEKSFEGIVIFANHEKCYDPENDHKYIDAEDFISQELCTLPEEFFVAMDIAPTMLEQYMIK